RAAPPAVLLAKGRKRPFPAVALPAREEDVAEAAQERRDTCDAAQLIEQDQHGEGDHTESKYPHGSLHYVGVAPVSNANQGPPADHRLRVAKSLRLSVLIAPRPEELRVDVPLRRIVSVFRNTADAGA